MELEIKDNTKKSLSLIATIFYLLFVILEPAFQTISLIVLLFLLTLVNFEDLQFRLKISRLRFIFLGFTAFYFFSLFSFFWSSEKSSFLKEIQPNLSYPIIVFIAVFLTKFKQNVNIFFILLFSITVLVYNLNWINYFRPTIEAYFNESNLNFELLELYRRIKNIYWNINNSYFNHYTYASYLANVSSVLLIHAVQKMKSRLLILICCILVLMNSTFVLLLKSKINIVIIVLLLAYCCYLILRKYCLKKYFLNLFLLIFSGIIFFKVSNSHYLSKIKLFQAENTLDDSTAIIDHMRYEQYKLAYKIFNTNKIIGVGLGDIQPILSDSFSKREDLMYWHGLQRLNTHSQFIHFMAATGILGLFFFLFFLFYGLYFSVSTRNNELFIILLIFALNCLFENILARSWGTFILCVGLLLTLPRSINQIIHKTIK
jgi:hypothetical protein